MKRILLTNVFATFALKGMSGVYAAASLPDTSEPFHLLIEKSTATKIELLPGKSRHKVNVKKFIDDLTRHDTQVVGLIFKEDVELGTLLSPEMVDQLKQPKSANTFVYVGPKHGLMGDLHPNDDNLVVLVIGKNAMMIIKTFETLGASSTIPGDQVKSAFTSISLDDMGMKTEPTGKQLARDTIAA